MRILKVLKSWADAASALIIFAAAISISLQIFAVQVFPAPDWAQRMQGQSLIAGILAFVVLLLWLVILPGSVLREEEAATQIVTIRKPMFLSLGALMFAWVFSGATLRLPVWVAAVFSGHEVELAYTVADDPRNSDGKCPNALHLKGMPLYFDSYCGLRKDVQMSFSKGDTIIVGGSGTSLGVVAQYARHHDEACRNDSYWTPQAEREARNAPKPGFCP